MMLVGLVAIGLALHETARRRKLLLAGAATVIVAGLVLSFTRGAWIGFGAGLMLLTWMHSRRTFVIAAAGMTAVVLVLIAVSPGLRARVISITNVETDWSNLGRIRIWRTTADVIATAPVLGVGDGNYRAAMAPYLARYGAKAHSHPHNALLQQWATKGLIGLAAYIAIWFVFFHATVRALPRAQGLERGLLAGGIAAVTAFHLNGLFESNFNDSEVAMMLWFIVGIVLWARQRTLVPDTVGAT
jgi:O-antigen ligase